MNIFIVYIYEYIIFIFNINVKLNHKISVIFYNLKIFDSDLIMQKLDKFNYKINVTPNVLEK